MNTRTTWIFGFAALGLVLAAPAQANPDFMDGPFIVANLATLLVITYVPPVSTFLPNLLVG